MLYFVTRVGNNYGVLDTDDGSIDWISKEQFCEFAKLVHIEGFSDMKPRVVVLPSSKCNWSSSKNIFKDVRSIIRYGSNEFILRTNSGKRFKGVLLVRDNKYFLHFSYNVAVPISGVLYESLLSCSEASISLLSMIRTKAGDLSSVS